MIPSNTPAVARYNAVATFNGSTWILTNEMINTLGDIDISGASNLLIASEDNLFTTNMTSIKTNTLRTGTVQYMYLIGLTTALITLFPNIAVASGDKCFIEIEVFSN